MQVGFEKLRYAILIILWKKEIPVGHKKTAF